MLPESRQKLRHLLMQHESFSQFPYKDTTGHLTIGIGRNLEARGISLNEALTLLDDDIVYFIRKLSAMFPWFPGLDENRSVAIIDLCFNVGLHGLVEFKKMIRAIEQGNYEIAANEMLDSKWARQVGERAQVDANILRTGVV